MPSAVFLDEEFLPSNSDIELIIPVMYKNNTAISSQWKVKDLSEQLIATTLHIGSYEDIGYAYIALEEWMECNGYCLDGPPYESYLKGPECDCHINEYVTQVCFCVVKK